MDKRKGFAYCGLVCCFCSEVTDCVTCRDGGCRDKDWCKNFLCCREKKINGCFECDDFPCTGAEEGKVNMLDDIRIRAFSMFIKEYGGEKLIECLEANEKAGIKYHYLNELKGDYDGFQTEEEIIRLILKNSINS